MSKQERARRRRRAKGTARKRLARRLAAYSAATGAVAATAGGLASARDANAAVVYSGEVNIPIPGGTAGTYNITATLTYLGPPDSTWSTTNVATFYTPPVPGSVQVDLDGVGGADATFLRNTLNLDAKYIYAGSGTLNIDGTFRVLGMGAPGSNGWIPTGTGGDTFVAKLNLGDPVDGGQTFEQGAASSVMGSAGRFMPSSNGSALGTYSYNNGPWENGTGFVGVVFKNGPDTHYGWIRVRMLDATTLDAVIVDYAYNDTPDEGIDAGFTGVPVVPVPNAAALGLLALGGLGVRAYRQRQKSA